MSGKLKIKGDVMKVNTYAAYSTLRITQGSHSFAGYQDGACSEEGTDKSQVVDYERDGV